ncbi:hypothetical protein HaLaN_24080 [Haematococcus lacustris]|uniref:Uncharacterized protein n=1 Tax=Haematococcus lacustris TaxID=44745 RepID=A0A699ZXX1_HAELA|nr:hypothetical protein HaLaN_24080 [Haematococcus lacustris]
MQTGMFRAGLHTSGWCVAFRCDDACKMHGWQTDEECALKVHVPDSADRPPSLLPAPATPCQPHPAGHCQPAGRRAGTA